MSTYPDHILRMGSQHLAELKRKAAEFERQLWDAHESLEYEVAQSSFGPPSVIDERQGAFRWSPGAAEPDGADGALPAGPVPARAPAGPQPANPVPANPEPATRARRPVLPARIAPPTWSTTAGTAPSAATGSAASCLPPSGPQPWPP